MHALTHFSVTTNRFLAMNLVVRGQVQIVLRLVVNDQPYHHIFPRDLEILVEDKADVLFVTDPPDCDCSCYITRDWADGSCDAAYLHQSEGQRLRNAVRQIRSTPPSGLPLTG